MGSDDEGEGAGNPAVGDEARFDERPSSPTLRMDSEAVYRRGLAIRSKDD